MIYVVKGMLIVFVVSFAIVGCRQWQLHARAKRSASGRLLSHPAIAPEYRIKDHPAWERRFEYARRRALARKLRELGQ